MVISIWEMVSIWEIEIGWILFLKILEKLGGFECKSYTILNAPKLKRIDEKLYIGVAASKVGSINAQEILNGLSAITYVGKDLRIDCSGIESFEPLRNLSFDGRRFDIWYWWKWKK